MDHTFPDRFIAPVLMGAAGRKHDRFFIRLRPFRRTGLLDRRTTATPGKDQSLRGPIRPVRTAGYFGRLRMR
ncbi:MAG: hypothetical protein MZV64_11660 [Ignavibacteriales bacterium]|nr:hypothetical protein [Ignavibacteriales bacterium]